MTRTLGNLLLPWLKLNREPPAPPLGAHEVISVERAAPSYLNYLRLKWGARLLMLLVGAAFVMLVMREAGSWWKVIELIGLLFALAGALLNFLVIQLDYELRWYILTDKSLVIREGIWGQREITLTFANVQNVNVTQGPLERIFGISDVVVSTAGGAAPAEQTKGVNAVGHQGHLRGVKDPDRLRDQILSLLKKQRGAGLGDEPDPAVRQKPASAWSPAALRALREAADEARRLRALPRV